MMFENTTDVKDVEEIVDTCESLKFVEFASENSHIKEFYLGYERQAGNVI